MNRERENELRATFNHFDRDGNGRIDRGEFEQLIRALGGSLSSEELEQGFAAIDGDGNGTVDFAEFLAWFRAEPHSLP